MWYFNSDNKAQLLSLCGAVPPVRVQRVTRHPEDPGTGPPVHQVVTTCLSLDMNKGMSLSRGLCHPYQLE